MFFVALARLYLTARSEHPSIPAISETPICATERMASLLLWTEESAESASAKRSRSHCFRTISSGLALTSETVRLGGSASRLSVCRASLRPGPPQLALQIVECRHERRLDLDAGLRTARTGELH